MQGWQVLLDYCIKYVGVQLLQIPVSESKTKQFATVLLLRKHV